MNLLLISSYGELQSEEKKVLFDGLLAQHTKSGHQRPPKEMFSIFVKDQNNKVYGGIIVSFLWNGMEIEQLWVDESVRNQGWGRKLLQTAELEAVKKDCTIAYTNTFSWQAPGFYQKLGYTVYGTLKDFPIGNSLQYFRKKLSPHTPAQ